MATLGCGVGIIGMGVYLPKEVRKNDFWPESIKFTSDEAPKDAGSETPTDLDDDFRL